MPPDEPAVSPYPHGIDSYVVTRDGLHGKREHWMPGNVRRGTGPREKRPFDSEQDAAEALGERAGRAYQCSICEKWHLASEPKQ